MPSLDPVEVAHSSGSVATVRLDGAHVTRWRTAQGDDPVFLSSLARFGPGSAIRGGIPVVFPQFAERGPLPKHGFARTRRWHLTSDGAGAAAMEDGLGAAAARVTLGLDDDAATLALWPHRFAARVTVAVAPQTLAVTLAITNTGDTPFDFAAALHGYWRLRDVTAATVSGLAGARYEDRVSGETPVETRDLVQLHGETDRVYLDVRGPVLLRDGAGGGALTLRQRTFPDVVLWNPGPERGAAIADLGAGEWAHFACVEAAAIGASVSLAPGARWSGTHSVEVAPMPDEFG